MYTPSVQSVSLLRPWRRSGAALILSSCLVACGGGGGDGAGSSNPAMPSVASSAPSLSSALSAQKLGGPVPETYRNPQSMPQELILQTAQRLPAAPGRTYLKVTALYAGSATPSLLWLGPWKAESRAPRIQVPKSVDKISYELYNSAGSVSATWSLP
jgi:hypothetical protein